MDIQYSKIAIVMKVVRTNLSIHIAFKDLAAVVHSPPRVGALSSQPFFSVNSGSCCKRFNLKKLCKYVAKHLIAIFTSS